MTALDIMARFQPLMPEGIRFAASYPVLPYQDEEGEWHQPEDAVFIRVSTKRHRVDALVHETDFEWTDEMFRERIIAPMFSTLRALEARHAASDAD